MADELKVFIAFLLFCLAVIAAAYIKYSLFGASLALAGCALFYILVKIVCCDTGSESNNDLYN